MAANVVETIFRTRSELQGAVEASRELERMRAKLVALGQSTEAVDARLAVTNEKIAGLSHALNADSINASGQAFQKASEHGNTYGRVIRRIAGENELLGSALHIGVHPIAGALLAGVVAAKALHEAFAELIKSFAVAGNFKGFREVLDEQAKGLLESGLAAAEYQRSISGAVEESKKLTEITALGIEISKEAAKQRDEEKSAQLALTKAQIDEREKSGKLTPAAAVAERAAAERAFAREKLASDAELQRSTLERLKLERAEQEILAAKATAARQEAATRLASLDTPAVIATRIKLAEANLEAAKKEEEASKEKNAFGDKILPAERERRRALARDSVEQQKGVLQSALNQQFSGVDEFNAAKEKLNERTAEEKTARTRADAIGGQVNKLSLTTESGIESRQRVEALNEKTADFSTAGELAPAVGQASALTSALKATGLSDVESLARAIEQTGLKNQQAIARLIQLQEGNLAAYDLVIARMADIERRGGIERAPAN